MLINSNKNIIKHKIFNFILNFIRIRFIFELNSKHYQIIRFEVVYLIKHERVLISQDILEHKTQTESFQR